MSVDDPDRVIHADNLDVLRTFPDGRFTLVYLDPPFNTGRPQSRQATRHVRQVVTDAAADAASAPGSVSAITGFQ